PFTARSNRTWSLPFPVAPWATAVAPCLRAAATRCLAISGRLSAALSGYTPWYRALACRAGKQNRVANSSFASTISVATAPAWCARPRASRCRARRGWSRPARRAAAWRWHSPAPARRPRRRDGRRGALPARRDRARAWPASSRCPGPRAAPPAPAGWRCCARARGGGSPRAARACPPFRAPASCPDPGADAVVGEQLADDRMRNASVEQVDAGHPGGEHPEDAVGLRLHAAGDGAVVDQGPQIGAGQLADQLAGLEDPGDVREVDELLGADGDGQLG